jgi:hypothetical protein
MLLHRKNDTRRIEIADAIDALRSFSGGGLALNAEQERRARQHGAKGHLDPVLEAAVGATLLVEAQERLHLFVTRRSPVRASCERGQNRARAPLFFGCL